MRSLVSFGRWCQLVGGLVALAAGVAGCEGAGAGCTCSQAGNVVVQPALTSPVVAAVADSPCTAYIQPVDGGVVVYVVVTGSVTTATGSCQIHEVLANGSVLAAELSFMRLNAGGCCTATRNVGAPPAFSAVDGGAG